MIATPGPSTDSLWGDESNGNATRYIDEDVLCFGCGYNLRGLEQHAGCPECGRPVALSLESEGLPSAPRQWLKRLHRGFAVLEATFGILLVLPPLLVVVFLWEVDATDGNPVLSFPLAIGGTVAVILAAVVAFPALILVTSPEPRLAKRTRRWSSARITRWTACLVALGVASILITLVPTLSVPRSLVCGASAGVLLVLLSLLGMSYLWYTTGLLHRSGRLQARPNRLPFVVFAAFVAFSLAYAIALVASLFVSVSGDVGATLFIAELFAWPLAMWALFAVTRRLRQRLGRILRTLLKPPRNRSLCPSGTWSP